MTVTQRDVALRAGVSGKTVSNVLNDHPYVREEVRARVRLAMHELGYRPNRAAQSFRTGRTALITLAIPELRVEYFAELATFIELHAAKSGYTVLISQTQGDPALEQAALDGFSNHLTEGLLFSPVALDPAAIRSRTDTAPLVTIGEQVGVSGFVDHVGIDNRAAAFEATETLLSRGSVHPVFLGLPAGLPTYMSDLRLQGFKEALRAHHVPWDDHVLGPRVDGFYRKSGYDAMQQMLDGPQPRLVDSLLCANDLLAQGAMRALIERGLGVPSDVAVIGFDDIEESAYSRPSLSSIAQDKKALAHAAVDLLLSRIAGNTEPVRDVVTPYSLVERESSAAATPRGLLG